MKYLVLVLATTAVFAQKKIDIRASGGTVNVFGGDYKYKSFSPVIRASVSYGITKNTFLGIYLGYEQHNRDIEGGVTLTDAQGRPMKSDPIHANATYLSIGLRGQTYFGEYFYACYQASYMSTIDYKLEYPTQKGYITVEAPKENPFAIGAGVGVESRKWKLSPYVEVSPTYYTTGIGFGIQSKIGIRF